MPTPFKRQPAPQQAQQAERCLLCWVPRCRCPRRRRRLPIQPGWRQPGQQPGWPGAAQGWRCTPAPAAREAQGREGGRFGGSCCCSCVRPMLLPRLVVGQSCAACTFARLAWGMGGKAGRALACGPPNCCAMPADQRRHGKVQQLGDNCKPARVQVAAAADCPHEPPLNATREPQPDQQSATQ